MCIYPSLLDDSFQSKSKAQKGKDKKKQTMKISQEGKQGMGVHIDTCLMYYKKKEGEKKITVSSPEPDAPSSSVVCSSRA